MSRLRVTLIDVGWGDSIFIESYTGNQSHYALIDSNDTANLRSSHIFLKRFFEKQGIQFPVQDNLFDWVLLSHVHTDHGQGLKKVLQDFGADNFWYPKTSKTSLFFTDLLRYARRYGANRGLTHQAIDSDRRLPLLGDTQLEILWPPEDLFPDNENNNSIVLSLTLGNVTVVLSGDAEADVWDHIAADIPATTRFFKLPHHGSENGFFSNGTTPWLTQLNVDTVLGISSHIRPFSHPSQSVIDVLENEQRISMRTDENYHITFETDGTEAGSIVKYSHV